MSRESGTACFADTPALPDRQVLRGRRDWPPYLILLAAVTMAVALAFGGVRQKSVTVDEFAYLPEGLAWLDGGSPRLNDGNPPVFKILAALPVLQYPYKLDRSWWQSPTDFWRLGRSFMYANASIYQGVFARARLVPIVFLACVCAATFVVARQLYGAYAAAFAAALTALNPTVLAHGSLVTPDIFFTFGVLVLVIALQAFVRHPTRLRAGAVGGALGLACLFKLSGFLLILPLWLASLFLRAEKRPRDESAAYWRARTHRRYAAPAALALWATLNAGYLFEGSFSTLRTYDLLSPAARTTAGWVPVPLPRHLVESGLFQLAERGYPAYLNGILNNTGFWQYYVWTFLYKTPPAVLLLVLVALLIRRPFREEFPLVAIGAGCFILFSALKFKNIGIRYLLFCYPLMHIWISRVLAGWRAQPSIRRSIVAIIATAGLVGTAWSEATIWPDHLAYFNGLAGGPKGGPRHLLDSNVDWGQDLLLLKRYMAQRGVDEVDLAYFGRVDPAIYGIRYRQLTGGGDAARHRMAVISVNLLYGRTYFVNGSDYVPPSDAYRAFRELEPVERLGHTLYVYDRAPIVP